MEGAKVWFFPDGDLPAPGEVEPKGHESLIILNPNPADAEITLTVYHEDREPDTVPVGKVDRRRVSCFRMDKPLAGSAYRVPFGQYALRVESSVPVVCQIGRMDVQQPNLAYYTVMGFPG